VHGVANRRDCGQDQDVTLKNIIGGDYFWQMRLSLAAAVRLMQNACTANTWDWQRTIAHVACIRSSHVSVSKRQIVLDARASRRLRALYEQRWLLLLLLWSRRLGRKSWRRVTRQSISRLSVCLSVCLTATLCRTYVQGVPKNDPTCSCQNFVKSSPNLIIFGHTDSQDDRNV